MKKDGKVNVRSAHAVDSYVGKRMVMRRLEKGISQKFIAEQLGISYQQVQKYEKGYNRLSASRLYFAAKLLGVPINYFFDGFSPSKSKSAADVRFPSLENLRSAKIEGALRDLIDKIIEVDEEKAVSVESDENTSYLP